MDISHKPTAKPDLVIVNGKIVPFGDATISVMAPGFTFAVSVFEGLRAYWNADHGQLYVFRLDEHLERLQFSMRLIELDPPPPSAELAGQVIEILKVNKRRADTYIRVQAYVDDWGEMMATGPVSSSVICRDRPRAAEFETGKHFVVSSWRRNADDASPPRIKATANYLNSRLAGLEALRAGGSGAIILNRDGSVSEGPGGCLFFVRKDCLITPPVTAGILESLTRDTLLELAADLGLKTEVRDIGRTELYLADEGFYCGTGQEVVPVLSVDQKPVGDGKPGPLTRQLQAAYDDAVRGRAERYRHWATPVYE
jgi:branched-chain amino acid aminotransferase